MNQSYRWEDVVVSLVYRLGEKRLFALSLPLLANRTSFTRMAPYAAMPDPADEAGRGVRGYFYPCYPVAFDPEPIERRGRWIVYTPYRFDSHYIDLKAIGSFDAYMKGFSSKSRNSLLRKVRKLQEANGGELAWRVYRSPEEVAEFMSSALPLANATYQARLLDAGLPESAGFAAEAAERAAAGEVRAYLLFLQGAPVAYVFCFVTDGVVTYDFVGYSPSARELSPGTVLQYLLLQDLFQDPGCQVFDFTEGDGDHKRFFGRTVQPCAKSYFLEATLKNALIVRFHHRLNGFVEGVGALLDRLGLKSRIRAWIRRTA